MYCGPGFESFPIALGTVEGQQEVCDAWDDDESYKSQQRFRKWRQPQRVIHDTDSESSAGDSVDSDEEFERQCLTQVIEIFPDISPAFVKSKIRTRVDQLGGRVLTPQKRSTVVHNFISEILGGLPYPKESVLAKPDNDGDGTGVSVPWNKTLVQGQTYQRDAVVLLRAAFNRVPISYIREIVHETNSIFQAYVHLHEVEAWYPSLSGEARPYQRRGQARIPVQTERLGPKYPYRVNEFQAARQHVARELFRAYRDKARDDAEAANLAEQKQIGALLECRCCFDCEVPLNRAVACQSDRPHHFCFACVQGQAISQIGIMKYEMLCMDGGGCTSELSPQGIAQAVEKKVHNRLEVNKHLAEIAAADIKGLAACPFCDFRAVMDEVEVVPIFNCLNPECARSSCRRCNKDSHCPEPCDEAQAARHRVEEARSDAVMRTCPQCKVKIVKEGGCNKVTCSGCGCILCYECRIPLGQNPYNHFSKPGAGCSLYDKPEVDRHAEEANKAEREVVDKLMEKDTTLDREALQIDTGQQKKKKPHRQRPRVARQQ